MVVQTVPLRVKEAGGGLAPLWLPTNPKLSVLPLFGARFAFQLTGVTTTFWPFSEKAAFQVLAETYSVVAGKAKASVQPLIGVGPVSVTEMLATKPLSQPVLRA